nr:hypothetical protein [Tanacetum cinerariifolium]
IGNKSENVYGGFNGQRHNYGEGTSRGGFSSRGRGGFGDQRFNRGESLKYVSVKKNGNKMVKDGMVSHQSNKGKNKQDVDMNTNEVDNRNGVNKGSMDFGKINSRKKNIKKHNTTDNSIEEKNSWDEELRNYFMMKMQEVIKRVNVSDLKAKISNLKKQIGHSNKMIQIETRDRANNMVKSVMVERGLTENQAYQKICDKVYRDELDRIKVLDMWKQCAEVETFFKIGHIFTIYELETWTNKKLEFYKASIGEEANMNIFKQVKSDSNESMDDEVVEDLRFMILFLIPGSGAQTLWTVLKVRELMSNRIKKNLMEHKIGVGNESWVLLGDFNIILNINENINDVNVRCEGMKEFRECVENIEVEDIIICGLFYTWIQRMRNPKLEILKKLDRVMAVLIIPDVVKRKPRSFRFMNFLTDKSDFLKVVKDTWYIDIEGYNMFKLVKRLKALKKHMRNLNKKNGNFFDKVKFLKTKLAKVQESLNRDPSCSKLREEELFNAQAYKDASINEEKLLRQKTKVEWLKEGDSNTSYFYNVIKGRVSKSRIKAIYNDSRDAFYGNNVAKQFVSHFSNFHGTCDNVCGSLLDRSCLAC